MEALAYLVAHPEIKHGRIMCAFGPDEEIGTGADHFDVKQFPVDYAYTIDGESLGQLEYETFNAAGGTAVSYTHLRAAYLGGFFCLYVKFTQSKLGFNLRSFPIIAIKYCILKAL